MEENNQNSQAPDITGQEALQQSQYASVASQQSEYEQSAQAAPEPQSETLQPQYGQEYGQQSAQPQYNQSQPQQFEQPAYNQQPSYEQQYNQQSSAQPQPAPGQYGQSQSDQPGYAQYSQPASREYQYASPQQQYEQPAASASYPAAGVAMGEGYQYQQQSYGQQYQQSYEQPYQAAQGYPYPPANYGGYGYVGQKSKTAAGLLGIFFGSLGVHNFYLGNTGKAVAQLLLTVIGWIVLIGPVIASIWGLIEGILILTSSTGSEWHKDGKGYELRD